MNTRLVVKDSAFCKVCEKLRPMSDLIKVTCVEHDGRHHHFVCRPTIPEQDHLTHNCFRRGTLADSVHRIAQA